MKTIIKILLVTTTLACGELQILKAAQHADRTERNENYGSNRETFLKNEPRRKRILKYGKKRAAILAAARAIRLQAQQIQAMQQAVHILQQENNVPIQNEIIQENIIQIPEQQNLENLVINIEQENNVPIQNEIIQENIVQEIQVINNNNPNNGFFDDNQIGEIIKVMPKFNKNFRFVKIGSLIMLAIAVTGGFYYYGLPYILSLDIAGLMNIVSQAKVFNLFGQIPSTTLISVSTDGALVPLVTTVNIVKNLAPKVSKAVSEIFLLKALTNQVAYEGLANQVAEIVQTTQLTCKTLATKITQAIQPTIVTNTKQLINDTVQNATIVELANQVTEIVQQTTQVVEPTIITNTTQLINETVQNATNIQQNKKSNFKLETIPLGYCKSIYNKIFTNFNNSLSTEEIQTKYNNKPIDLAGAPLRLIKKFINYFSSK